MTPYRSRHLLLDRCRNAIARHRLLLRIALLLAIAATLVDGFLIPRNVVHLLVGHTLLLLALGAAWVAVEEIDSGHGDDFDDGDAE